MKPKTLLMLLVLMMAALLSGGCRPKTEKEVTFFPGYGYRDAKGWNIHLRGWVHKPRNQASAFISELAKIKGICGDAGMKNFAFTCLLIQMSSPVLPWPVECTSEER